MLSDCEASWEATADMDDSSMYMEDAHQPLASPSSRASVDMGLQHTTNHHHDILEFQEKQFGEGTTSEERKKSTRKTGKDSSSKRSREKGRSFIDSLHLSLISIHSSASGGESGSSILTKKKLRRPPSERDVSSLSTENSKRRRRKSEREKLDSRRKSKSMTFSLEELSLEDASGGGDTGKGSQLTTVISDPIPALCTSSKEKEKEAKKEAAFSFLMFGQKKSGAPSNSSSSGEIEKLRTVDKKKSRELTEIGSTWKSGQVSRERRRRGEGCAEGQGEKTYRGEDAKDSGESRTSKKKKRKSMVGRTSKHLSGSPLLLRKRSLTLPPAKVDSQREDGIQSPPPSPNVGHLHKRFLRHNREEKGKKNGKGHKKQEEKIEAACVEGEKEEDEKYIGRERVTFKEMPPQIEEEFLRNEVKKTYDSYSSEGIEITEREDEMIIHAIDTISTERFNNLSRIEEASETFTMQRVPSQEEQSIEVIEKGKERILYSRADTVKNEEMLHEKIKRMGKEKNNTTSALRGERNSGNSSEYEDSSSDSYSSSFVSSSLTSEEEEETTDEGTVRQGILRDEIIKINVGGYRYTTTRSISLLRSGFCFPNDQLYRDG